VLAAIRLAAVLMLALSGVEGQQPETLSMLETPLYAPSFPRDVRTRLEAELTSAKAAYAKDPKNADAALACARAQEALGHVGDALETLARAIDASPDEGRLRLERARALIVFRKFESAERDARKALETIPDASCTLGLALYLRADFPHARDAYSKCPSAGIFYYLSDRRSGGRAMSRPEPAAGPEESPVPEVKLPGSVVAHPERSRPTMTAAYLDAAEKIAAETSPPRRGRKDPAEDALKAIVEKEGNRWMEPVYIAAEADYARILKAEGKFKKPGRKKK
jgi:tetratricopeptide (TPR) repeat protein